jgi:hypothetical protein
MLGRCVGDQRDERLAVTAIVLPQDLDLARALTAPKVHRAEFVRHSRSLSRSEAHAM